MLMIKWIPTARRRHTSPLRYTAHTHLKLLHFHDLLSYKDDHYTDIDSTMHFVGLRSYVAIYSMVERYNYFTRKHQSR
jgi:hypothetical protein